jgi:hypothetical protein
MGKASNNKYKKTNPKKKLNNGFLVAIIILVVFSIYYVIHTTYNNHYIENHRTEIISAKIFKVGVRHRGGLGTKSEIGYIKFKYIVKGEEFISSSESFQIRDEIEKYKVGDCIELKVSLENKNIYKWNEEKGTFKCR